MFLKTPYPYYCIKGLPNPYTDCTRHLESSCSLYIEPVSICTHETYIPVCNRVLECTKAVQDEECHLLKQLFGVEIDK